MNNQYSPNSNSLPYNPNDVDISAKELAHRLQNKEQLNLLDVRESIEFHTHNIGGINIPLGQLESKLAQLNWNKTDEIIVICQAGLRSETACSILQQNGYEQARNLTGGLLALRRLVS